MAYFALENYTGDGVTTDFAFTAPRLSDDDILGYENLVLLSGSMTDPTTFRFDTAPVVGSLVVVRRVTALETPAHHLVDPVYLTDWMLNENQLQTLYNDQEILDDIQQIDFNSDSAAASAAAAAISAAEAQSSEDDAQISEDNAALSESAAATSAFNADLDAAAASASEIAATASAGNALTSETNALASENAAALSETAAGLSETAAGLSETAAATSETNALSSELKANKWAEEAWNIEVEPGEYSAMHWAIEAAAALTDKLDKVSTTLSTISGNSTLQKFITTSDLVSFVGTRWEWVSNKLAALIMKDYANDALNIENWTSAEVLDTRLTLKAGNASVNATAPIDDQDLTTKKFVGDNYLDLAAENLITNQYPMNFSDGSGQMTFDDQTAPDGRGIKRITLNDGGGNWNFRGGHYFNAATKSAKAGDGSCAMIINTDAAAGNFNVWCGNGVSTLIDETIALRNVFKVAYDNITFSPSLTQLRWAKDPAHNDDLVRKSFLDVRGALVGKTANQATTNVAWATVNFGLESYDTDNIHSNASLTSRLTVPAGVTKIRLTGQLTWVVHATGNRYVRILRNGSLAYTGAAQNWSSTIPGNDKKMQVSSAILTVIGGQYFEMQGWQSSGTSLSIRGEANGSETWFAMEILQ